MLVKDVAICLARRDYSETSQIVTAFTRENGKVSGIAKGSRRTRSKFSGGMELLSAGQLVFSPGRGNTGLFTLTEWAPLNIYQGLRGSITQLNRAYYLAELVDLFTEELDPHPEIYDLLCQALERLCSGPMWIDLLSFQVGLLRGVGLWPDLTQCTRCGKVAPPGAGAYLSSAEGGLLCRECANGVQDKIRLYRQGLHVVRGIAAGSTSTVIEPNSPLPVSPPQDNPDGPQQHPRGEDLPRTAALQAQRFLAYWIRSALNREPRTAALIG